MTSISINARLQPTEDPEKVSEAIRKIFGDIPLEKNDVEVFGKLDGIDSLQMFRYIIHQNRIRDTLRNVFRRWSNEDRLGFGLNRQAAFSGHVSINLQNEDPMGPIQVEIKGDVERVIRFLCNKR